MISRLALLAVLALALRAHDGGAQSVPAVSADLTAGAGSTSTHAGDTWFRAANAGMVSADLAVRIGGAARTRVVVVLGYSLDVASGDHLTDCPLAPNGGCKGYFPNTFGPSIGVGLRQALGQRGLVGVSAGVASYASQARFAEVDASWRIVSHLAIVGEFRYIDMPFGGQRAWFLPLTFGARLYW
jgi:hypothetical protein